MAKNTIQRTPSRRSSGPAGNAGKPYRGTAPTRSVSQGKGKSGGTTKRGAVRSGSSVQAGGSHAGLHAATAAPGSKSVKNKFLGPGASGQKPFVAVNQGGLVRGANHRSSAKLNGQARHKTVSTADLDGEVSGS